MITKSNIEEYLFDYFEGNLTAQEKIKVDAFVKENPEFQSDYQAWSSSYLPDEKFVFSRVDELLVPEGKAKPVLFGRWKTSLLFLAVSISVSAAFMLNNFGEKNKQNKLAEEQDLLNKSHSKDITSAVVVSDLTNGKADDSRTLTSTSNSGVELTNTATPKTTITVSEENSKRDFKNPLGSSVGVSSNVSNVKSIEKFEKGKKSLISDSRIPSKESVIPSNSSVMNNKMELNKDVVDQTSSVKNSSTVLANNTKEKIAELLVDRKNDDYLLVDLAMKGIGNPTLVSSPDLKKGRSKFEAYDKNELKFFNDKNPYIILPNVQALTLNSSFAGNSEGVRLSYLHNHQIPQQTEYYSTNIVSLDTYVKALRGGLGLVVERDVLGHNKFRTQGISVIYAPKFNFLKGVSIEPSIKYGFYEKSISWNQVKTPQQIDSRTGLLNADVPNVPTDVSKSESTYSNFGGGLLLNTNKFYVGFGFENLFNPSYNLNGYSEDLNVEGRFTAQAGGSLVPLKKHQFFVLHPAVYYLKHGGYDNLWLSNTIVLNSLFLGTSYAINNDLMLSLGFNNQHLRINYSFGLSSPAASSGETKKINSHQVGLVFLLKPQRK